MPESPTAEPLLTVEDLGVSFATEDGVVRAVDGVSFELRAGEVLAIVGESGCGKSVTAQTIMGLTRSPNAEFSGSIHYGETELVRAPEATLRAIRGEEIAMVFQDSMTSLHPVYRVGWQIAEQIRAHEDVSEAAANDRAVELLAEVGIPDPAERAARLPARAVGRHAPAGDDRDGAREPAQDPHRRRADDGARRDDPGADHRAARRPAGRAGVGGADHPRPGGGRGDRRPRARDVRRNADRAGGA